MRLERKISTLAHIADSAIERNYRLMHQLENCQHALERGKETITAQAQELQVLRSQLYIVDVFAATSSGIPSTRSAPLMPSAAYHLNDVGKETKNRLEGEASGLDRDRRLFNETADDSGLTDGDADEPQESPEGEVLPERFPCKGDEDQPQFSY